MNEHTNKQFDADMEAIRTGVLSMGGLVEKQLARAIGALENAAAEGVVDAVGTDERQINQMQVHIDQLCSQIIARRQPAASDLRMVLTTVKITNDLERIGDEIKKIAYKAASAEGDKLVRVRFYDIVRAAGLAQRILRMALDSFARLDVEAAVEIVAFDDELDAAFGAILRQLISYMMEDPRTIGASIEIVFMAKSIERIGDHAKNIAEAVVQAVKGTDVRHQSAAAIRAEVEAK
jgi:phosphate transport system protein